MELCLRCKLLEWVTVIPAWAFAFNPRLCLEKWRWLVGAVRRGGIPPTNDGNNRVKPSRAGVERGNDE